MSNLDLSIIIVSFNVKDLLRECLESIWASLNSQTVSFEVVVVDNASDDDTCLMLKKEFTWVKLIEAKKNLGFSKANNLGTKDCLGEFILFLNPDTKPCLGSLEKMTSFLKKNLRVGIVGPRFLNEDGTFQPSIGVYPSLVSLIIEKPIDFLERKIGEDSHSFLGRCSVKWRRFKEPSRVDWVGGAGLMCRREVFGRIHGFDENFFMYFEDVDFCLRAKKAGWKVYFLPQAKIYHLRGRSQPAKSRRKAAVYYQSQDYFFAKHRGRLYSNLVKIIRLPYQILDLRSKIGRYY